MFETEDRFTITTKRNVKKFKSFLGGLMLVCVAFSIIYFIYFGLMYGSGDETTFEYTKFIFEPLANFFHPEIGDLTKYRATGVNFLFLIAPLFALCIVADIAQGILLSIHEKIVKIVKKNLKIREEQEYVAQFEKIKYFSIAVSFDYKSDKGDLPSKAINQLNKVIYEKMSDNIFDKYAKIQTSGIFSIISTNFQEYDELYEKLLKVIRKIKNVVEEKYNIQVFPTVTTDAYTDIPVTNKITATHFAIKGCNLKNKAINTNLFSKKYAFLGMSRFLGSSIGLYNSQTIGMDLNYNETYDLYVVIRNLREALKNF